MSNPEETIEPEVMPPTEKQEREQLRFREVVIPLASGIVIDFLDMASFDRIGFALSGILGAVGGLLLARMGGLHSRYYLPVALVASVYCAIPRTGIIPLATIIAAAGLFRRLGSHGDRRA